jgi:hypothetical protein
MNQPNLIKLGVTGDIQTVSPGGRKFSVAYEDGLYREERAASGRLRRDVITEKKVFTLAYSLTDTVQVDRFDILFKLRSELALQVQEGANLVDYTVLMSPFSKDRLIAAHGGLWENVNIELREV